MASDYNSVWLQAITLTWGSFLLVLGKCIRWGKTIGWLSKCGTLFANIAILLSEMVVAACEQKSFCGTRFNVSSNSNSYLNWVHSWVVQNVKCQKQRYQHHREEERCQFRSWNSNDYKTIRFWPGWHYRGFWQPSETEVKRKCLSQSLKS